MRTLKILGFYMTYPEQGHIESANQCLEILRSEAWLSRASIEKLASLFQSFQKENLMDLQETYVALFDRTPSLSLHLFEHVHGDSRDRGQALVDLLGVYEDAGLFIDTAETPDYLPLFAEYLSHLAPEDARETIGSVVNILSSLAERLRNRGSEYACILDAMVETAGRSPDEKAVQDYLKKSSGDALSLDEMDREWEEQFAFNNTPQTTGQDMGCPKAEEMLARMSGYKEEERV
ncbi:nitrate reductase molybdenum cofactor assembly chaperone [Micavibrio aeruginosavorus]|uniref:Respiratory nitrate reductase delta chain n=1 Tax=Micavibrio aeruginosavorus EPB TaxID=349215 RepID=M4VWT2_9BACT|nr:nitrate reductase molybdenum cofactor assembly chaperone [Micavibrio aeruginosavorus]AGH97654.1 Respiratory nitrate reductase delta chain [Micavibrio aeruginosavorus EPB]